jgi:hypothetical protein
MNSCHQSGHSFSYPILPKHTLHSAPSYKPCLNPTAAGLSSLLNCTAISCLYFLHSMSVCFLLIYSPNCFCYRVSCLPACFATKLPACLPIHRHSWADSGYIFLSCLSACLPVALLHVTLFCNFFTFSC